MNLKNVERLRFTWSLNCSQHFKDLRKRFKYLNHLPLSCDVTFIEVDLTDIVSKATLQAFKSKLLSVLS